MSRNDDPPDYGPVVQSRQLDQPFEATMIRARRPCALVLLLGLGLHAGDVASAQESQGYAKGPWHWIKDTVGRFVGEPLDPRAPKLPPAYAGSVKLREYRKRIRNRGRIVDRDRAGSYQSPDDPSWERWEGRPLKPLPEEALDETREVEEVEYEAHWEDRQLRSLLHDDERAPRRARPQRQYRESARFYREDPSPGEHDPRPLRAAEADENFIPAATSRRTARPCNCKPDRQESNKGGKGYVLER